MRQLKAEEVAGNPPDPNFKYLCYVRVPLINIRLKVIRLKNYTYLSESHILEELIL